MLYTVLLPAHRADAWLAEAVASVEAAMGGDDGELLIVANGPAREEIVAAYPETAQRRVVTCELISLDHALNVGIEQARGTWIARMDSDDLCHPDRFRRQIEAMERGGTDFLFGAVDYIGADGEPVADRASGARHPDFGAPLIHPTAMIRREALVALGGYGNMQGADDHQLWLRAIEAGYRFASLPDPVLRYRVHDSQSSRGARNRAATANVIGLDLAHALRNRRPGAAMRAVAKAIAYLLRAR